MQRNHSIEDASCGAKIEDDKKSKGATMLREICKSVNVEAASAVVASMTQKLRSAKTTLHGKKTAIAAWMGIIGGVVGFYFLYGIIVDFMR